MDVHFSAEQEERLSQLAGHNSTEPEELVKEAALRLLEENERFRVAVREGIEAISRGESVEHEEVWANVEKILAS